MYSENKEIASRIDEVVTKITRSIDINEWDLIKKIFEEELKPQRDAKSKGKVFSSYHNSLNLAFLLLNEESSFSYVFWKSYAQTYQVSNNLFIDDLNVNDINHIIGALEKESKNNQTIAATLGKFKNFISQNGLLRTLSKTQIEFAPTLDQWRGFGALAVLNDNDESLDSIIHYGRSILSRVIFSIYGLKVTSGLGTESYVQPEISDQDINSLIKRNLLKKVGKKHIDRYKELTSMDLNSSYRDYINVYVKSEELINQIDFRGEIENDIEGKIGFYGIFDSVLKEELRKLGIIREDEDVDGNIVSEVVSHSIETLRTLVDTRYTIFNNSVWGLDEAALTLVAGLSNPGTIKNAVNNGEIKRDSIGKSKMRMNFIKADSAKDWITNKNRKYKVFEPIEDVKPIKDIDYDYLREEIGKVKERIEKLKKAKIIFNDNDTFARTNKEIFGRVAQHNKDRWEWIGKGKTFKELNEKNSTYRKNIKRKTFKKNKSPITQDILYDVNSGYIKQIK